MIQINTVLQGNAEISIDLYVLVYTIGFNGISCNKKQWVLHNENQKCVFWEKYISIQLC